MDRREILIAKPCLGDEEFEALRAPLSSGWLTQGPQVKAFEQAFARRHQTAHALATTSCTTALHLLLAALGIGPGDEVIVPALTWVATANAVLYQGATPVFADIDSATFNLDPESLAVKISSRTKLVVAVHLFGLCADMVAIARAAGSISVVADAACAAGAAYKGVPAGGTCLAEAFSFHPRKIITTGEGGMVTTNDDALAEKMECLRNHGASISEEQRHLGPRPYLLPEFNLVGFNYRMTDLQGAVGLAQLAKLDGLVEARRNFADMYRIELAGVDWLSPPVSPEGCLHSYQSFVCRVDPRKAPMPRNEIMDILHQKGIHTRPGTHAVPALAAYRNRPGINPADYPRAVEAELTTLALPMHNLLTEDDIRYVASVIKGIA